MSQPTERPAPPPATPPGTPSGTALVTGAGGGLGGYLARRLAEDGWAVTGVLRPAGPPADGAPAEPASGDQRAPGDAPASGAEPASAEVPPPGVTLVRADLATDAGLAALLAACPVPPRLLVHCAVSYPTAVADLAPADLDAVFRVNAVAPYELSRRLLARTDADTPMTVVCVNSEAMYRADDRSGVYGASKAALRVLTTALAAGCRGTGNAVASLVLGPLATPRRMAELAGLAVKHGRAVPELAALALRKTNPDLVLTHFIELESCHRSVTYVAGLGPTANGMVCRLDGGSAGSLI